MLKTNKILSIHKAALDQQPDHYLKFQNCRILPKYLIFLSWGSYICGLFSPFSWPDSHFFFIQLNGIIHQLYGNRFRCSWGISPMKVYISSCLFFHFVLVFFWCNSDFHHLLPHISMEGISLITDLFYICPSCRNTLPWL